MKNTKILQTGFTLIEMLAVLFIIGIIFSITLPTFGPMMGTMKLKTTAENVVNALESARQYAVTSGKDCYVAFPVSGELAYKSYKIYRPDTNTSIGKMEVFPTGIKLGDNTTFLDGATVSIPGDDGSGQVNAAYIKFSPAGGAWAEDSPSGSIYIVDQNTDASKRIIYYSTPAKCRIDE